MVNPLQFIEVRGEKREVLLTPSLYKIAKERGWTIKTSNNIEDIQSAYIKLLYAGLLNALEVRAFDNIGTKDTDVTLIDIEIWASQNQKEFGKLIIIAVESLTGKSLKTIVEEKEVEKKKNTSIWFWITKRLKSF